MVQPDEESIVRCETTAGVVTMKMHRQWSPNGYDRAVELFERHFYDGSHFYRVVKGFLVQFGISYSGDQELQRFAKTPIPDDPPQGIPFHPGTISYAGSGDNSRTSQLFISYGSAASLGTQKWETPIGEVIEGMENVEKLYSYGDMPPWGEGPSQGKVHSGPSYIEENFPKTDKFVHCKVERLNGGGFAGGDESRVIHKADGTTDEEEFHQAREALEAQQEEKIIQEKMHMQEEMEEEGAAEIVADIDIHPQVVVHEPYRPHTKDQPGLPSEIDRLMSLGGICVLGVLVFLLFMMKGRKKDENKYN